MESASIDVLANLGSTDTAGVFAETFLFIMEEELQRRRQGVAATRGRRRAAAAAARIRFNVLLWRRLLARRVMAIEFSIVSSLQWTPRDASHGSLLERIIPRLYISLCSLMIPPL